MSEEDEQKIGDRAARQVEAQLGLVRDAELAEYVSRIGAELARHSPRRDIEYSFHVVNMVEPNAFALPGGYIYLSRGLVALSNSEAELAGVIGHEIGHVAARHAAARDTYAKTVGLLTLLGTVAAAAAGGGGATVGATQLLGAGFIAAYSRGQESESDRIAQELAVEAGIDPAGLADFLQQLDASTRLRTGASRLPGFLDSHPATPERFADAITRADVLRWEPRFAIAPTRALFLAKLDGLVVGQQAAEGVFRGDHFLHADLDFALHFPHGWTHRNEPTQVMSMSPAGDAIAILQMQGPGDDPRAAAAEFALAEKLSFSESKAVQIGGHRAFRARTRLPFQNGSVDAVIAWIAYRGTIYRLAAGSRIGSFPKYEGIFRAFARSFRSLRPEDREKIDELRLRTAVALEGESIAQLCERSACGWDANETAVANALTISDRLEAGQLVKIARRERYTPPPRPDPALDAIPPGPPVQGPLPPPADPR